MTWQARRCRGITLTLTTTIAAAVATALPPAPARAQGTTAVFVVDAEPFESPCDGEPSALYLSRFSVGRSGAAPSAVAIAIGGTAVAGVDYRPVDPSVTFVNGSLVAAFTPQGFELLPGATPGRTIVLEILVGDGYEVAEPSVGTMTIERVPCPTTTTTTAPPGVGLVGDAPSSDTEVLARTGSSTREAWLAGLGALLLAGGGVLLALGRRREAAR